MDILLMILSLGLFIVLGKKAKGTIISLTYLSGIFWMIYTAASYAFMKQYYSFSMIGIMWINIAFWFMLMIENLRNKKAVKSFKANSEITSISKQSWLYMKICLILGIVAFFYQVSLYGVQFSDFLSLNSLASMNNTIAVARYSGNGIVNILTQILLIFVYAAPACGGYAFVYSDTHFSDKIWSIMTLLPAFLMVLFTNTKAVIIGAGILWASSYWISYFSRY